ncbi:YeeE/YedE thiosulfate transporter family protein, partial [uncultured Methylobacterium sp.]|uniref:YeeE/YedE thiosulfate transporter family protein n=1 Tax=uncultured Methylobacterium sp. TaxID=157278 RepID=UPI0035CB0A0D
MTAGPAPDIAAHPKAALDPRIGGGPVGAASVALGTILRWSLAALVVLGLGFASDALLAQPRGANLSLSLILGALFGFVLQRSRFCFLCHWRDFLDARDPRGILAILAALAVGIVGYTVVYGAWMPDPSGTRLPPGAHIGPVSPILLAAGLSFGAGMAISGSCISAHLYRLGEGSPTA